MFCAFLLCLLFLLFYPCCPGLLCPSVTSFLSVAPLSMAGSFHPPLCPASTVLCLFPCPCLCLCRLGCLAPPLVMPPPPPVPAPPACLFSLSCLFVTGYGYNNFLLLLFSLFIYSLLSRHESSRKKIPQKHAISSKLPAHPPINFFLKSDKAADSINGRKLEQNGRCPAPGRTQPPFFFPCFPTENSSRPSRARALFCSAPVFLQKSRPLHCDWLASPRRPCSRFVCSRARPVSGLAMNNNQSYYTRRDLYECWWKNNTELRCAWSRVSLHNELSAVSRDITKIY